MREVLDLTPFKKDIAVGHALEYFDASKGVKATPVDGMDDLALVEEIYDMIDDYSEEANEKHFECCDMIGASFVWTFTRHMSYKMQPGERAQTVIVQPLYAYSASAALMDMHYPGSNMKKYSPIDTVVEHVKKACKTPGKTPTQWAYGMQRVFEFAHGLGEGDFSKKIDLPKGVLLTSNGVYCATDRTISAGCAYVVQGYVYLGTTLPSGIGVGGVLNSFASYKLPVVQTYQSQHVPGATNKVSELKYIESTSRSGLPLFDVDAILSKLNVV